jgi:hypothetical protein
MANELKLGETAGALNTFIDAQYRWNERADGKLDALGDRIGALEKKAAVTGAVGGTLSGALVSVGIGLAMYYLTRGQ